MATVKCPSCGQELEVEDAYRDWTVSCPHCGEEFVPSAVDAPAPAREDDRPRRRPRERDDDERERERDRYEEGDERDWAREEALQIVAAPGLWMEICGWITALGSIGMALLCVVLAVEMANNPQNGNQNGDGEVLVILGCCGGVFGVPYGVVMAIGGRKMRNLSSHGWALTASILGVVSFAVCGFAGAIQTGIGVWALTALNKPVVREAFGLSQRRRRRRRRRDWDD
jgi:hypothetical protein